MKYQLFRDERIDLGRAIRMLYRKDSALADARYIMESILKGDPDMLPVHKKWAREFMQNHPQQTPQNQTDENA